MLGGVLAADFGKTNRTDKTRIDEATERAAALDRFVLLGVADEEEAGVIILGKGNEFGELTGGKEPCFINEECPAGGSFLKTRAIEK